MKSRILLSLALGAGFLLAACQDQGPVAVEQLAPRATVSDALAGRWIVVFDDRVSDAPGLARQLVAGHGGTLHYTYQHAIKGFAASLPDAAVEALRRNPVVAMVEADQAMYASGTQSPATWGLDRIDQRSLPLNNTYGYDATGAGVTVYIIDTGIRLDHAQFVGRAASGYDAVDGGSADDCNGHGTHVAGTVGGSTHGVAKAVELVAVRVLNCRGSGTTSGVIAGIDWVTANHASPAVANMSLGGGASTTLDNAVRNSIAAGVSYAIAAGNSNANACNYSPARVAEAMTIGATTSSDSRASYSNYGSCVDWFAPGSSITSAWHTTSTATNTISGTSMAAPHVAGVAALYLQGHSNATPAAVRTALYDATTKSVVSSANTTNNHLLYSGFESGGGSGNASPVASFTSSCNGLTCSFDGSGSTDDVGVVSWSWSFGDGTSGSGETTSHIYPSSGTRTVTLTVTDASGATGSTSQAVTVTAPSTGGFELTAVGGKTKGVQYADLSWAGVSGSVVVKRDGAVIATVSGSTHHDPIGNRGGGTYVYQVCLVATPSSCSNPATVVF